MAVQNSLQPARNLDKKTTFTAGNAEITLTYNTVKSFLVSGDPANVTDQEVAMFIKLCQFQHLNPWLREAYLIKYGNQPATIVTGKEAITKRAYRNATFRGQQAGVIVQQNGTLESRVGSMVLAGETLVGGWAKVFVDGYAVPIEANVGLNEYIGRKKDGSVNQQWATKAGTMIRKVALMQALREAFPEDLGGMYSAEEVGETEAPAVMPIEEPQVNEELEAPQDETAVDDEAAASFFDGAEQ